MIVVGLNGVAGVGKDVGAAALVRDLGFTRIGFADTLREAVYRLNPIVVVPFELGLTVNGYADLREVVDYLGWEDAKRDVPNIRELLQRMGTEVGRQLIDDHVWIQVVYSRAAREGIDRLVIPDVRFPNELQSVIDRNGICFRIKRPGFAPINAHASDNALTDFDFSNACTIVNGTTEEEYQDYLVGRVNRLIDNRYFYD